MSLKVVLFAALAVSARASSSSASSELCSEDAPTQAQSLLQAHHTISSHDGELSEKISKLPEFGILAGKEAAVKTNASLGTDPSGAAAPLNEVGYAAVADRCCQAEMKQFIERQVANLNLEICNEHGVTGLVPYHSCEKGPQTFQQLTATLLAATEERCLWVAKLGMCKEMPDDCPNFAGAPPSSACGCHSSKAAKLDFSKGTTPSNNLGGKGPQAGPEEMRFYGVATTHTGDAFDIVVTTLGAYEGSKKNGIQGTLGCLGMKPVINNGRGDFRFSFMQPGTNTPFRVPEFHMTFLDLDGDSEFISSTGYRGYVTDVSPSIGTRRLADGRTEFTAGPMRNIPNPSDANSLTAQQRAASVMAFYVDVTSFDLTFGHELKVEGRNLFFSGGSSLDDRCSP